MALAGWIATAHSVLEGDVWKKQDFEAKGMIGEFDIESDLRFEPYKNRFKDWITKFEWEPNELAFTLTSKLTRTTDWLILELEREWEEVEFDTAFRLRAPSGSCRLLFYDASADAAFDWCGIETDLEVSFDDDGFDEFVIEFSDLCLEKIPWVLIDLEITRTQEKSVVELSSEIVFESPWCSGCFDLGFEGSISTEPNPFPFSIDEVSLAWDVGGWEVDATAAPEAAIYWLEIEADTAFDLDPCGEVSLDLTFLWTEIRLGRVCFVLIYEPSTQLAIIFESDIDLETEQLDRLVLGVTIEW